jgi:hypothetical protein
MLLWSPYIFLGATVFVCRKHIQYFKEIRKLHLTASHVEPVFFFSLCIYFSENEKGIKDIVQPKKRWVERGTIRLL